MKKFDITTKIFKISTENVQDFGGFKIDIEIFAILTEKLDLSVEI